MEFPGATGGQRSKPEETRVGNHIYFRLFSRRPGGWVWECGSKAWSQKTCPLPYSLGPMPGLGAKVPGPLHDLPAVSSWNKASPLGLRLLICQVGMRTIWVAGLPYITPRSQKKPEKFRFPGVWPPCQSLLGRCPCWPPGQTL